MLKIKTSKKFQKDLLMYKAAIDSITDESEKQEYQTLLNKLIEQFKLIDAAHDTVNRDIDPTQVRDNVERSIQIRRQLNKIVKDFKSSTNASQ